MGLSPRHSTAGEMATPPSANPKNLFAFLLGMLTLTQGLVLPTESLLLRRAAKVQKRNQFPIANGFTGPLQKARCHEEVLLESLTRPARHQTPVSSERRPVPIWTRQSLRFCPLFRFLAPSAVEVRYPNPTSYCGAPLEHSCFRIRRSWPENGLSVRRSLLNPNNRIWDGSSC